MEPSHGIQSRLPFQSDMVYYLVFFLHSCAVLILENIFDHIQVWNFPRLGQELRWNVYKYLDIMMIIVWLVPRYSAPVIGISPSVTRVACGMILVQIKLCLVWWCYFFYLVFNLCELWQVPHYWYVSSKTSAIWWISSDSRCRFDVYCWFYWILGVEL
jgi:hypothetical protein